MILALIMVRGWLSRHEKEQKDGKADEPFIASFTVCNPAVFGHTLGEISHMDDGRFVVSRLWRDGKVILPNAQTLLEKGDRMMVITTVKQLDHYHNYFDHYRSNRRRNGNHEGNPLCHHGGGSCPRRFFFQAESSFAGQSGWNRH